MSDFERRSNRFDREFEKTSAYIRLTGVVAFVIVALILVLFVSLLVLGIVFLWGML